MSVSANEIWRAIYDRVVGLIKAVGAGSGFPGGADTQVQYNNDGSFAGMDGVEWDNGTQQLAFTGGARFKKTIQFFDVYTQIPVTISSGSAFVLETPLDWDASTDMTIRLRWACEEAYATNSGEICFQAAIFTAALGAASAAITSSPFSSGDINIPATLSGLAETTWTIDKDEITAGDTISIVLSRLDIADGNDPVADLYFVSVRLEYTANRWGDAV